MRVILSLGLNAGNNELLMVAIVLGVLFIAGVVAVFIFIKQWRKEHTKQD